MFIVEGKEFSTETVVKALKAYCNFEEEKKPYIFKAGDVVAVSDRDYRIIVRSHDNKLVSFDGSGNQMSKGQKMFEYWGYKKIGTLIDFIKEN